MHKLQKIITAFFILLFSFDPHLAICQIAKGQSELSVGAGVQSIYELNTEFTAGDNNNYTRSPAFALSYRYYLSGTLSLGLNVAYQHFVNYNVMFFDNPQNKHNINYYTFVAPEITISYLDKVTGAKKNELRLYGLASAGIAIYAGDNADMNTNGYGHTLYPRFRSHLSVSGTEERWQDTWKWGSGIKGLLTWDYPAGSQRKNSSAKSANLYFLYDLVVHILNLLR